MRPIDFLKQQQEKSFCGYLKAQSDGNKMLYKCGNPTELITGTFDEPCTGDVWDICPLNVRYTKEQIIKNVTSLPEDGKSTEANLPPEMSRFGIKWIIENKNGEYNVFRHVIYPSSTISKPPKVVTEKTI